ncbi:hypothetical protein J6590_091493 [Homalodisca vitripennis]|nr:hypothetical protein J6590_091493 [Homalodisca vitripennis]
MDHSKVYFDSYGDSQPPRELVRYLVNRFNEVMISDETKVLQYVDARINEKVTIANDDSMMIKQYVEAQINEKLKDFASPYGDETLIKQYVEAQITERFESFRRGGEVNLETLRHTLETVQNDLKSHTEKADELTSKLKFINNKVNVKNRRIVNAAKSVDEHDVMIRKEIDDLSRRLNEQTSFTLEENIRGFNRRFEQLENWKRQCANTVSELYEKVFSPIE